MSNYNTNSYTKNNYNIIYTNNYLKSYSNTNKIYTLTSNNTKYKTNYQNFYYNKNKYQQTK